MNLLMAKNGVWWCVLLYWIWMIKLSLVVDSYKCDFTFNFYYFISWKVLLSGGGRRRHTTAKSPSCLLSAIQMHKKIGEDCHCSVPTLQGQYKPQIIHLENGKSYLYRKKPDLLTPLRKWHNIFLMPTFSYHKYDCGNKITVIAKNLVVQLSLIFINLFQEDGSLEGMDWDSNS